MRGKGWDSLKDSELLVLAQEQFDVLLTIDRSLEFQQNIAKLTLGVVVAHVPKNQMAYYELLQPDLIRALERVEPGKLLHVGG